MLENKRVIQFSPPDISELEAEEVVAALKSGWIMDSRGNYSLESTPGTVFLWAIDNNNQISYAIT